MEARMAQHKSELEQMFKQRNDLDEKYKKDLTERNTRDIVNLAAQKREN